MSIAPKSAAKTRIGCQNCRLRHLKCDELRPSCGRCVRQGLLCDRTSNTVRFRHGQNPSVKTGKTGRSDFDFTKSQPWVKTAAKLVFLDDSHQLHSSNEKHQEESDRNVRSGTSTPIAQSFHQNVDAEDDVPTALDLDSSQSPQHRSYLAADMVTPTSELSNTHQRSMGLHQAPTIPVMFDRSYSSPTTNWPYSPHSQWTASPNGAQQNGTPEMTSASDMLVDYLSYDSHATVLEATASDGSTITNSQTHDPRLGIYLDASVYPISSREEAALLRYYVKRLARAFDLTDPQSNFEIVVPQRAATCPLLLNAIYALSARHLSRVGNYDPLISDRYHQECLKRVIPVLDDSAAILDENLLASTIILRHLEEIGVPVSGYSPSDRQSHLLGSHAFIKAQRHAVEKVGLRQAAFWVGLRQEIYVAFVNQRTIAIDLDDLNIDRTYEPAADHIWSCRMVVLCADVLRYCFGEGDESTSTYERLCQSVSDWHSYKNESFTPIMFKEADDSGVFPEIWFPKDDIMIGWQHYYIAKLLLCAHDPKVPRLGPRRAAVLRAIDEEIKEYVRMLCGIAMSNADLAPNFTYASMSIVAAGDKFTEPHEREALLHVLNLCDTQYAIPTRQARENLTAAWSMM